MLSVFTYKFGRILQPIQTTTEVLGDSDVNMPIQTSESVKSVISNADGTKTEITKQPLEGKTLVKLVKYDMFGEKIAEKTYDEVSSDIEINSSIKNQVANIILSKEQVGEKVRGLGYTYNATSIGLVKDKKGELYKVSAYKSEKLFGLLAIKIPATIYFRANDGTTANVTQTVISNFLDLVSR